MLSLLVSSCAATARLKAVVAWSVLTATLHCVHSLSLHTHTSLQQDFKDRVRSYEQVYETIEDNEDSSNIQYIKLYNVGQKVVTRNCKGYLPSQVAFYLQNIHIGPRKVMLLPLINYI
jgi:6-phosphofructo-2-kinase